MLGVIDLGISNIGSVMGAFKRLGVEPVLVSDAESIEQAGAIVLPGVGAFGDGMAALREKKLIEPLRGSARAGKPILGFCLGMQLLADHSEEYGEHEGLGLIPGSIVRLQAGPDERVPNIGWCDVVPREGARLFHSVTSGTSFYFVHSYHMQCSEPDHVAATVQFDNSSVTMAVEHGNIYGLQFHPEKSQDAGLMVLDAFLSLVKNAS